jgi:hypothetical protein
LKRKLTIVAMVVLAAIFIATPVLAAGSSHPREAANPTPKKQPTIISMTATILSVGKDTIDVKIQMTNRAFIQYRRTEQTVRTNGTTKYVLWVNGRPSGTVIGFADLTVGQKVSINARVVPETPESPLTFTARRVQVNQPRIQIP